MVFPLSSDTPLVLPRMLRRHLLRQCNFRTNGCNGGRRLTASLDRQPDDEGGSPADLGLEIDRSPVFIDHDRVGQREPLAGSLADFLGGEEEVEDPWSGSPRRCRGRCLPRGFPRRARPIACGS